MNKQAVANDVADQLFEVEQSVDEAMAKAAKLVETMVYARRTLDLSTAAGQVAVRRIAGAVSALSEVRSGLVAAHANLERLGNALDIPVEASGGGGKPVGLPFPEFMAASESDLLEGVS